MRTLRFVLAISLVFAIWQISPSLASGAWIIQTGDSEDYVGESTCLALDSQNHPHISYSYHILHDGYDTDYDLNYARWNGTSWIIETVDSEGDVGRYTSIALDSHDYAHISYFDWSNWDLKYARWNGTSWIIETVDSKGAVGAYTSIALDSYDYAHISYYDSTNDDLKYARWNGTSWIIETVDSEGTVGAYTSLALDSQNHPHISYYKEIEDTYGDLKYARWNGTSWVIERVDRAGHFWASIFGSSNSIALDSRDYPHISYCDETNRDLKYAKWNGTSWIIETVDDGGPYNLVVGYYSSIALDSQDYPHISYFDGSLYDLKYAGWDGTSWIIETVDSEGVAGEETTSIALDSQDHPHISYYEEHNWDIKYARWIPEVATGTISAKVTDSSTGNPVSGARVSFNGYLISTISDGTYSLTVPASTYSVTASASGYESQTKDNITVAAKEATEVNFSLQSIPSPPSHKSLAAYYSPVLFQHTDTRGEHSIDGCADYITNFDFNGNWDGTTKWLSAELYPEELKAYVYYDVKKTSSHWFIYYAIYHPRDWNPAGDGPWPIWDDFGEHEHDMEAILLVVARPSPDNDYGKYGKPQIWESMAHNYWFNYPLPESGVSIKDPFTDDTTSGVTFWSLGEGKHPVAYIQAGGHGIFLDAYLGPLEAFDDVRDWDKVGFPPYDGNPYGQGTGVIYYYKEGEANVPPHPDHRNVTYDLRPIKELWEQRNNEETFTPTFEEDLEDGTIDEQAFKSAYDRNEAHPPWTIPNKIDNPGEEYRDPVSAIKRKYDVSQIPFSEHYFVPQPYLNAVISSPLKIGPPPYHIEDTIKAQFTISNKGTTPITFKTVTVGGRYGDKDEVIDFTKKHNIELDVGECYEYQGTLTLTKAGNYHFFCAYQTPDGKWNTSVDLGAGLTDEDRIEDIVVKVRQLRTPAELARIGDFSIGLADIKREKNITTSYFAITKVGDTDSGHQSLKITLIDDHGNEYSGNLNINLEGASDVVLNVLPKGFTYVDMVNISMPKIASIETIKLGDITKMVFKKVKFGKPQFMKNFGHLAITKGQSVAVGKWLSFTMGKILPTSGHWELPIKIESKEYNPLPAGVKVGAQHGDGTISWSRDESTTIPALSKTSVKVVLPIPSWVKGRLPEPKVLLNVYSDTSGDKDKTIVKMFPITPSDLPPLVGQGPKEIEDVFLQAYKRNGGQEVMGNPLDLPHWFAGGDRPKDENDILIQDFPAVSDFGKSAIIWDKQAGANKAYILQGKTLEAYLKSGGPYSSLKNPIADQAHAQSYFNTKGSYASFEKGMLISHHGEIYTLSGKILEKWKEKKLIKGPLGFPIEDKQSTSSNARGFDTTARVQRFEGGNVYYHARGKLAGQVLAIHGGIYKKYIELEAEQGWLGFPVVEQYKIDDYDVMNFEGGYITTNDNTEWEAIPYEGKIAFVSARDANDEIYVFNGKDQINLTKNPANDYYPSWSPNGDKIAFISDRDGAPNLYLMNTDGSNIYQLTQDDTNKERPAWSPNGSKIVFSKVKIERSKRIFSKREIKREIFVIFVINVDGSGLKQLSKQMIIGKHPYTGWSHASKDSFPVFISNTQIVFYHGEGLILPWKEATPATLEWATFLTMNIDATGVREATETEIKLAYGTQSTIVRAYSPDGTKFAYIAGRDIYIGHTDGKKIRISWNNSAAWKYGGRPQLSWWTP